MEEYKLNINIIWNTINIYITNSNKLNYDYGTNKYEKQYCIKSRLEFNLKNIFVIFFIKELIKYNGKLYNSFLFYTYFLISLGKFKLYV